MNELMVFMLQSLFVYFLEQHNKMILNLAKMLDMWTHFRMLANSISDTETRRKTCLNIKVNLSTDCAEGEDEVKTTPKELLELTNRHKMRS